MPQLQICEVFPLQELERQIRPFDRALLDLPTSKAAGKLGWLRRWASLPL